MALPQSSLLTMAVELPGNFAIDSSSCHYWHQPRHFSAYSSALLRERRLFPQACQHFVRPQVKTRSPFACAHLEPLDSTTPFSLPVYPLHHCMWCSVTQPSVHPTSISQCTRESITVLMSGNVIVNKARSKPALLELPSFLARERTWTKSSANA